MLEVNLFLAKEMSKEMNSCEVSIPDRVLGCFRHSYGMMSNLCGPVSIPDRVLGCFRQVLEKECDPLISKRFNP